MKELKELRIEDLTIEQKIGMLFVVRGFRDDEDKAFVFDMIKKHAVGAVQIWVWGDYQKAIDEVKEVADYPILICADMERGFPGSQYKIGSQMVLAATGDEKYAYEFARLAAIESKRVGYNVVWGPIVDIGVNLRRFSDDRDICTKYGTAMIKGYQDEGMICGAKHFPGDRIQKANPDRHMDGHIERKKPSTVTEEELMKDAFVPYKKAIEEADLSGVMVGHTVMANIDPDYPSSMSPKVISLLRKIGFDGVLFSDSMAMMGVASKYGIEETTWRPIAAGCDLVLPNYRVGFKEVYEYMMKAYKKGKITDERLDEAVRRVLAAQKKTMKQASATELTEEQKKLTTEISQMGITAFCHEGVDAKLPENTKKLFVIMHENLYPGIVEESKELESETGFTRQAALKKKELILNEYPDAEVMLINEYPHNSETEKLVHALNDADEAIFYTFTNSTSYLASSSMSIRIQYVISCYTDKISTVVHMGVVHDVKRVSAIKRVLYAFPGKDSVQQTLDALKGRFIPTGKLPIDLD
ncbi:MAG: glycoside hydrolase family 3 protein [Clostridia bacterium]|nr:glycoside hydrolase family 3 protein [Clostridia bacterium]